LAEKASDPALSLRRSTIWLITVAESANNWAEKELIMATPLIP
jgi:hypothetical protein